MIHTFRASLFAVALAASSGPVRAQTDEVQLEEQVGTDAASDEQALEEARQVYEQGVAAYEAREYERAIQLFKEADRLKPNAAFSFNIGIAYQDMGDSAMALRHYRDYLRLAPEASDRADVVSRVRKLEAQLQRQGVQQVTVLTTPGIAPISIDGRPVGLSPWTGELPPGNHEVLVKREGYEVVQRAFDLPPNRAIDVSVTLVERESAPALADAPPKASPDRPPAWYEDVRPVTWGVLGVGVGALGVALVSELSRDAARDELRTEGLSTQERDELQEMASSRRVRADSFLLLGLGMCATGGVLIYADMVEADSHRRALYGGCGMNGCALRFTRSF